MERYNLVVIGGGSGGLVVAAGGASLGARVALAEKHVLPYAPPGRAPVQGMGGDCLQYGCVPSKALLAAAKAVHAVRGAGRFGIRGALDPGVQDLGPVMDRVRSTQAVIAPNDSVERFSGLGVDVLIGAGRLKSPHEVEVNGTTVWGRHVVLATGSRPRIPEMPGLAGSAFLTNESVFDLAALPKRLVVMGGGPIGVELGQAFRRLGSEVTIVCTSAHVCPKEDADVAAVLAASLRAEGLVIHDSAMATSVAPRGGAHVVTVAKDGATFEVEADAILVAAGRRPNLEGLGLEAAGVAFTQKGVTTDATCRTNIRSVWAIGDVAGPYLFTHWAGHQAGIVLRNTLSPVALASCDFGEPALDHVHRPRDRARGALGGGRREGERHSRTASSARPSRTTTAPSVTGPEARTS